MLIIEYHKTRGYVFPDGIAEKWVNEIVAGRDQWIKKDVHIMVCSTLLMDLFRALIPEGKLSQDEVQIRYKGKALELNKYGRITHWPDGFCSTPCDVLERILCAEIDMVKKDKKDGN